jgi:P-type Ca2+ transporter type 2C
MAESEHRTQKLSSPSLSPEQTLLSPEPETIGSTSQSRVPSSTNSATFPSNDPSTSRPPLGRNPAPLDAGLAASKPVQGEFSATSGTSFSPTSFNSVFEPPISAVETARTSTDYIDYDEILKISGTGPDSQTESNPFAFTAEQLVKLHDPKSVKMLRAVGGIFGLAKGLRTDIEKGLSPDETTLLGKVTLQDVRRAIEEGRDLTRSANKLPDNTFTKETTKETYCDALEVKHTSSVLPRTLTARRPLVQPFKDRRRIFSVNRIPSRPPKNLLQLMWAALHDKILVFHFLPPF